MSHDQSYTDYINSPEWASKRELAFKYHGRECKRCASMHQLHVHHKTYKNFKNEDVAIDLVPLCKSCHKKLHRYVDKNSLDLFHGSNDFIANVSAKAARRKRKRRNLTKRMERQWIKTNGQYSYKYVPRSPDVALEEQRRRLNAYKKQKPKPPKITGSIDYAKMATQYGITVEEARTIAG